MSTPYNITVRLDPSGVQSGGRQVESALGRIEDRMRRIQNLAGGLLSAAVRQARAIVEMADAYTQLQNRLRVVTTDAAQLAAVQQELFEQSQRTRTDFGANVEMYARLSLATKDLGISARETLDFQESLNKAIILSGASASEARAGIFQLSQAMAKVRLDGDELRSVLENVPVVADVIAKSLNITRGELRKFGEQGKLTGDVILKAFAEARGEMEEKFGKTVPTVGQAMTVLGNSLTNFVGKVDQLTGFSRALADALITIAVAIDILSKKTEEFQLNNLRAQLQGIEKERETLLRGAYGDDWMSEQLNRFKNWALGRENIAPDSVERDLLKIEEARLGILKEIADLEERRRQIDAAKAALNTPGTRGNLPLTAEQERYEEILRRTNADLDKENELLLLNAQEREFIGKLLDVEEKMQRNKTPITGEDLDALEKRVRGLQQLRQATETVANAFQSMFKGMEDSLVSFATTGRFEFKRFADAVVADLIRIALQAYVTRPLLNFATGSANSLLGGMASSSYSMNGWSNTVTGPNLFGFAGGGEFTVGGNGGTDSQLVAFRASPNEKVRVSTPGQEMSGRGTTVVQNNIVVENHSGAQVDTQQSTGPDGSTLTRLIVGTVRNEIGQGGLDGVLGSRFGSSPAKKRR